MQTTFSTLGVPAMQAPWTFYEDRWMRSTLIEPAASSPAETDFTRQSSSCISRAPRGRYSTRQASKSTCSSKPRACCRPHSARWETPARFFDELLSNPIAFSPTSSRLIKSLLKPIGGFSTTEATSCIPTSSIKSTPALFNATRATCGFRKCAAS